MKIKRFKEENINEEFHPNDRETLIKYGMAIRKSIPTFDVNINGNVGTVKIDGMTRFTTQGNETMATILAYVTGMHTGLTYKK
jgi:hypothetical protein